MFHLHTLHNEIMLEAHHFAIITEQPKTIIKLKNVNKPGSTLPGLVVGRGKY